MLIFFVLLHQTPKVTGRAADIRIITEAFSRSEKQLLERFLGSFVHIVRSPQNAFQNYFLNKKIQLIVLVGKGAPTPNAMICLPTKEDLEKFKKDKASAPVLPVC